MDTFDAALAVTLRYEGGYVNDPRDAGGETRFGISKTQYPDVDIRNLTKERAAEIYREDYWLKYRCDQLPAPLGALLFDSVVNHSPNNPIRWLQTAVGVAADGVIGPRTIAAANACRDPVKASADFTASRIEYVKTLGSYPRFGKGWHARYVGVLAEALRAWGK